MTDMMMRRSRHWIVGSEVGRPRPIAYMRRGHTRRSRGLRPSRRSMLLPACVLFSLVVLAVLISRSGAAS